MKTHDILHRFVHRLDHGELQMCKHHLSLGDSVAQRNRRAIFTTLQQQQEYDRDALLKEVKDQWTNARLSREKNRLYNELLEVVGRLHRERDDRKDPWTHWQDARTLMRMGLMDEAADMAQQGLQRAMELEEVHAELQLRELLREVLKNSDRKAGQPHIMDNDQRLDGAVDKVRVLTTYSRINDQLLDYYKRYRTVDAAKLAVAIDNLMQTPQVQNITLATSVPAMLRYLHIKALSARMEGRMDDTKALYCKIIALWEMHPQRIAYCPHLYRKALANLIGILTCEEDAHQAEDLLLRMEEIPVIYQRDRALQFCDVELKYQVFYLNSGRLNATLQRKPDLLKGLQDLGRNISGTYHITLRYNLAVAHLMNDEPNQAKKLFNDIRDMKGYSECQDLHGLARLFRLLLLMNEADSNFDHYLRNSRAYFQQDDHNFQLEKVGYAWLLKHCKLFDPSQIKASYASLAAQLLPMEQESVVGAEELRIWAQAHAEGQSVRAMYLHQHKSK